VIRHLYLHIPFCTHICPYCAFAKTRNLSGEIRLYLGALDRELSWARDRYGVEPETTFWGGGTPTALGVSQLKRILESWPWSFGEEFTVEANPLTISEAKAHLLLESGVNRISLGVQAFDTPTLRTLGRTHDAGGVRKTMDILRRAGFENINIDLIFNVPGQGRDPWEASLEEAMRLEPEHVSTYSLTYELDTEFFRRLQSGEWKDDEARGFEFYMMAMERLEAGGWAQYEISNFARPGRESRHNRAIWEGRDYLGLGVGAVSTVAGERWKNPPTVQDYAAREFGRPGALEAEFLTENVQSFEKRMLGMRTREGIDWREAGLDPGRISDLVGEGYVARDADRLHLTRKGRAVADEVIGELIECDE